jgi:hypothetical protein
MPLRRATSAGCRWQNLAFVLDELGETAAAADATARAAALRTQPAES